MKRKRKILTQFAGILFVMSTIACGGILVPIVGIGGGYSVTPKSATISPGGSVAIEISLVEISGSSFFFRVDGGDASGTITVDSVNPMKAVYAAPVTPGDYIVRAGFIESSGDKRTSLVLIKVE